MKEQMAAVSHSNFKVLEPGSTFILPLQHDIRVSKKQLSKRHSKKKSLRHTECGNYVAFENKRSASAHTSASGETRFLNFEGEHGIVQEQATFCHVLETKDSIRKSFNRLDQVMKDANKEKKLPELVNAKLNQTLSEAPSDYNLPTQIEPSKIQNEVESKVPCTEDEIVYEESSQRYVDRKITQQFNI